MNSVVHSSYSTTVLYIRGTENKNQPITHKMIPLLQHWDDIDKIKEPPWQQEMHPYASLTVAAPRPVLNNGSPVFPKFPLSRVMVLESAAGLAQLGYITARTSPSPGICQYHKKDGAVGMRSFFTFKDVCWPPVRIERKASQCVAVVVTQQV